MLNSSLAIDAVLFAFWLSKPDPRPRDILVAIVSIAGVAIVSAAILIFTENEAHNKEPVPSKKQEISSEKGIAAGGDVKGSPMMGDLFGTDAIKHAFEHQRALVGLASPVVPASPPPVPLLNSAFKWIDARYEDSPGRWIKDEPSRYTVRLAIAIFENPPAPRERQGVPLKEIEANLKIYGSDESERIATAYWLNSDSNRIDIPSGHQKTLVLGYFTDDGMFVSNQNEHNYSPNTDWPGIRRLGEEKQVKSEDKVRIDINLVEAKSPHRTIESLTIEIDAETKDIKPWQAR